MEPTTFGALLKRYRMAAGLTQEALAERANLSARAISDLERGLSRAPRYDTLDMLTSAMNLEASSGPRCSLPHDPLSLKRTRKSLPCRCFLSRPLLCSGGSRR